MPKCSDFGKAVKIALIQQDMTQEELMRLIREKTGLFVDSGYLWKILSGQRSPQTLIDAIREILDLPDGEKGEA